MNRHIATAITLVLPSVIFLPMMLNALSDHWHPSGSEASGFVFLSFALVGVFIPILAFPAILNRLIQRDAQSFRVFLALSCLIASIVSVAAFFLYPVITSMPWSNFDPTLVIGVVVIQCFFVIPLASLWWWLTKPHNSAYMDSPGKQGN